MNDWIEHNGGPCPVSPDTVVDVRYRDSSVCLGHPARVWAWSHRAHLGDIIAYRIVEEPKKTEEQKYWEDASPLTPTGLAELRDRIAIAALQGILAGPCSKPGVPMKEWLEAPEYSYKLADAMLIARKQNKEG